MEFKGTKGKWEMVKLEKTDFCNEKNEIHFGEDGECVAEYVANDYDALLISKAPEMLEMLNNILFQVFWNGSNLNLKDKENIENLIKEATEIK